MHFATSMEAVLSNGGDTNDQMSRYFKLFPSTVIESLVTYTNQQLATRGLRKTNAAELRTNIALQWARSRYIASSELLWVNELSHASEKHKFDLPERKQFIDLLTSIRGYPVVGRRGDGGDVWIEQQTSSKNLRPMKKRCFNLPLIFVFHVKMDTL